MREWIVRTMAAAASAGLLISGLAPTALGAKPAEKKTVVDHRFTFFLSAPDDICGPYPADITFSVRNHMLHWTEEPDGRFNVHFTQTGTYHVDFVDPAREDQVSQYTDSIQHVFTPGQVEVFSETFHDFPDEIKIWVRIHATVVDGHLVVEREVTRVTGCP